MELQANGQNGQQTALVTGSSNGIGEAIVKALAKLDFKLVVTGRNEADISRVAGECALLSPSRSRPLEVRANLELDEDVRRLFAESMKHFNGRLDLLVNNAGFSGKTTLDKPEESWKHFTRTMQINLNCACLLILLACEPLRETTRAHCAGKPTSVINISSIAAVKPLDDFAYCVSKCALTMLSNCFAGQLGPLVRVNCLKVGPVETKLIERSGLSMETFKGVTEFVSPMKRVGQVEEIAEAVLFLADPERASFITGSSMTIDGGVLCSIVKL